MKNEVHEMFRLQKRQKKHLILKWKIKIKKKPQGCGMIGQY